MEIKKDKGNSSKVERHSPGDVETLSYLGSACWDLWLDKSCRDIDWLHPEEAKTPFHKNKCKNF